MSNIDFHSVLASDNLSDCAANIAYWLDQVPNPGGAVFTADAITTTPMTINGFSTGQTADLFVVNQNASGTPLFVVATVANAVNGFEHTASATGVAPSIVVEGTDTNISLALQSKGTGSVNLQQGVGGANTLIATGSGTVVNQVTVTASATGVAPIIAATGTDTNIALALNAKGTSSPVVQSATAPPAAGSLAAGLQISSTAGLGVYVGSGAPTFTAAQGALYLRTDGSSTSTRAYINTTGSTTWTNITTAA